MDTKRAQHSAMDILIVALEGRPSWLERLALRFLKWRLERLIFRGTRG